LYTKDGTTGDSVLGLAPDFKFTQQDLTELNADGNRERGRNGEDESKYPKPKPPLTQSPEFAAEAERYVESTTPQEEQKYKGWFWSYPEKKFYRWDNRP
tara:strand:+ start:475 stop:771 length:297 start_codon:yes stop_codon:yes gene_type:complete